GKIVVTDVGVLHFQPSLQQGLRERAGGVETHAQSAMCQDLGIERLEERHIHRAFQAKVELLSARQIGAAMRGEISSTPRQVEILDEQGLIRDLEANGADVMYR